ncbi:hypothetical protein PFUGPA_04561 [Plasmodium falciparum Palo Alto/Uganda]|uniref:Uncharacterized protein n=3 Tax=Plasmodium falciparum TaxID=5833 RepID=W4ITZ2_PLAFP|nr:hypothetical protein PFUGPA_04561 [Plasmodium falciparum Palo Alto/Uganda]ETW63027.1 hypothetical protein PFMC_01008 [Plasmodium falciparum CAMP/Malaysia]EUR77402.1 hypothetical protein PFBG_00978 [Plasmodium falciparum 7G8]
MENEQLNSLLFPDNTDEKDVNINVDISNKNEALENYLSLYTSQNIYDEPMNNNSNTLNNIGLNIAQNYIDSDFFNNMEWNKLTKNEINNINSLQNSNMNELFNHESYNNGTVFEEDIAKNINGISENDYSVEKDFKYYFYCKKKKKKKIVHMNIQIQLVTFIYFLYIPVLPFYENSIRHNEQYYHVEGIKNESNQEIEELNKSKIIKENENVKVQEDSHIIKEIELKCIDISSISNENTEGKENASVDILIKDSSNLKSEKNRMMYNECNLTNDFFETVNNINTEVSEKYNNLKDSCNKLLDVINKSDYEKKINDLLNFSQRNSELVDQFKQKSDECIQRCRKFETTSENIVGECINTLAHNSLLYAQWVSLHSCDIDQVDNILKDIKMFIQMNQ